jgi:putative MATE family efflux protein
MPLSRIRTIVLLAIPIVGGMVSQNMLNLVDTAMVGSLGNAALAAVGTGGFLNFLSVALLTGLSAGVQALASRRKGEEKHGETALPLNGALLLSLCVAVPLSLLLAWLAPAIFSLVNDEKDVADLGGSYYRLRVLGMLAVGINFSFRGFWNGISRPGNYFITLLAMHSSNIALNWLLIYGHLGAPKLGTDGAAIATTLSLYLGSIFYLVLGWRKARQAGFLRARPEPALIRQLAQLSGPNGLQQMFIAGGYTVLFWILGQVGTQTASAAHVLINVVLLAFLPGMGLGMAAASLVGQALGKEDRVQAKRWGWDVVKVGVVLLLLLGLPMWLAPAQLLGLFLHDHATVALATPALRLVGLTIWADGIGLILLQAMVGAGDTKRPMLISVGMQWGLFLPLAYILGPVMGYGLFAIWTAQMGYRALQALLFIHLWRRGDWAQRI